MSEIFIVEIPFECSKKNWTTPDTLDLEVEAESAFHAVQKVHDVLQLLIDNKEKLEELLKSSPQDYQLRG